MQKQMKKHGLDESRFQISEKAMQKIIHEYTRESGVRALERRIASLCRKADREILEKNRKKVQITERNLEKYLGKSIYETNMKAEHDEVGIVRGLAWTSVGGDTLEIEVNLMPGKGKFELTGQLGDVMQESAKAGISYIRSVSDDYELDPEYFQQHDHRRPEGEASGSERGWHEDCHCTGEKPPRCGRIVQRDHRRTGTGLCTEYE